MLTITIGTEEVFNDETQQFEVASGTGTPVQLEHSLVSLSKWEEFYEKPFLGPKDKTSDEVYHYVQDMAVEGEIPPELFSQLSQKNIDEINEYIVAQKTATWFNDPPAAGRSREIITSEVIYYWMISLNIPFEAQYWHLNRLLTLIKVCNQKNQPPKKKLRPNELAQRNRDLNAQRKAQMQTSG